MHLTASSCIVTASRIRKVFIYSIIHENKPHDYILTTLSPLASGTAGVVYPWSLSTSILCTVNTCIVGEREREIYFFVNRACQIDVSPAFKTALEKQRHARPVSNPARQPARGHVSPSNAPLARSHRGGTIAKHLGWLPRPPEFFFPLNGTAAFIPGVVERLIDSKDRPWYWAYIIRSIFSWRDRDRDEG